MSNNPTVPQSSELSVTHWPVAAAHAAEDKLATDVVIIDVGDVLAITGYFVIASGSSNRQVRAIAEEVQHQISQAGGPKPLRREGFDGFEWVLIDYGDFVVHAMHEDTRQFYGLERLWGDQPVVAWESQAVPAPSQSDQSDGPQDETDQPA